MTMPITIKTKVRFDCGRHGSEVLKLGEAEPSAARRGRVPRVARLLVFPHRFEKLIRDGEVRDYADLARLGHVTRARLSQIMDLLLSAPDAVTDHGCSTGEWGLHFLSVTDMLSISTWRL